MDALDALPGNLTLGVQQSRIAAHWAWGLGKILLSPKLILSKAAVSCRIPAKPAAFRTCA